MAVNSRAFQFVQQLAANLRPELDLPAFPDVVRRLQIALISDRTTIKDIVNIIGSEPVLSARLMQMANSAAMNPAGSPVASLNNAVNRLGFNHVRTVSTAFALRQLSRNESLGAIRPDLEQIWATSNEVASICYAVAKQAFGRQPDEAMLAGGLPVRICEAVENQDYLLNGGSADLEPLTRLLSAAKLKYRLAAEPELLVRHPDAEFMLGSVNLGKGSFMDLMLSSQSDIQSMHQALAA